MNAHTSRQWNVRHCEKEKHRKLCDRLALFTFLKYIHSHFRTIRCGLFEVHQFAHIHFEYM